MACFVSKIKKNILLWIFFWQFCWIFKCSMLNVQSNYFVEHFWMAVFIIRKVSPLNDNHIVLFWIYLSLFWVFSTSVRVALREQLSIQSINKFLEKLLAKLTWSCFQEIWSGFIFLPKTSKFDVRRISQF